MMKAKSAPPKKVWAENVTPIEEAIAETSEVQQNVLKVRCFICKGKREHHWD